MIRAPVSLEMSFEPGADETCQVFRKSPLTKQFTYYILQIS